MTDSSSDAATSEDSSVTGAAESSAPRAGLSRRGLFGLVGAGIAVGAGAGIAGTFAAASTKQPSPSPIYPFYGEHQAGITTEVQDHLHFATFDMMPRTKRDDLTSLLEDWTYASSRMTQGLDVSATGAVRGSLQAPPDDTGEALGLRASGLTITIGLGPSLFERNGEDRFGIADRKPAQLADLPVFLGDDLRASGTGGDLCIQACADDPQVAVHAIRNLSRIAFGRATIRWSQLGFGRTSKTTADQSTPRNLFGFKDGTANILANDTKALNEHVWISQSDQAWMTGGTFLVARKIAMLIESWDRVRLAEQQRIIGRDKGEGAPLAPAGSTEQTEPDFTGSGIDVASHVRLAHPQLNDGVRILRRGYNYVDGNNELGKLDAGLFFPSFQNSPEKFITLQRALSTDLLNEYIRHVGSGLWAIPPSPTEGQSVAAGLFR